MAEPNPSEVSPWYLRNITQALELNSATGQVFVRTNASIVGNVTVGNVAIGSLGNVDLTGNTLPVTVESGNVTVYQGTTPWVTNANITGGNVAVTGTVNIGTMPEVEIKNDSGNPIPISRTTSVNSETNPVFVEGVNNASFFSPVQSDAFGRLRVSNPFTLFDSQNQYHDNEQFVSNLVASGNCVYNADSSTFLMSVTGTGDAVYRETVKTFVYQPGKSLLVLNSFCGNTPASGLTQRVGYFNDENGVYFEVNGTTKNMVIRSSSTGSVTYETVPQSSWNGDRLDGSAGVNNPSGITLNVDRLQIFWTDVEWLGSGSVRTGFMIDGNFIVCHTFQHANSPGNVTTYMSSAILPCRYELISTGPAADLRQICSTVISEGGYTVSGKPNGIGHALNVPVRLPNDVTFKPLLAIRLKTTNPDAVVVPVDFTIVPEDQALVKYRVYPRATTTGGSWVSAGAGSSVEYNLAPGSIVTGDPSFEGFLISNNQSINTPQNAVFDFVEQLTRQPFTGVMYEYVLTAATTGTNIDVYATINWQEVT